MDDRPAASKHLSRGEFLKAGGAGLAGAALMGVSAAVPPASAVTDSFYVPPNPLPAGQPGDVIRSREIFSPAFPDARVWQVMYLSTGAGGKGNPRIAVTGAVLVPRLSSGSLLGSDKTRPVVGLTPGTRGLGDRFAPSKQFRTTSLTVRGIDYEIPLIRQLLGRGYGVAVTDYEGAGTPALPTYIVGRPSAQAGLDVLRAAQRLDGAKLPDDGPAGIAGYSQGGQAAGWLAEIQPEYAPELDLKGVALGGVPTDLNAVIPNLDGNPQGAGVVLAGVSGMDTAYPELRLDEKYLTPRGRKIMTRVRRSSTIELITTFGTTKVGDITEPDVLTLGNWRRRFAQQLVGTKAPEVPVYLYHGTEDQLIPFELGEQLRRSWCDLGATVEFQTFQATEHLGTFEKATPTITQYLTDRFAGRPAPSNC